MNNKIVDANFIEVDSSSKKYSTIEEVGDLLSVDVPTIIFWCNKFNYILNVQSIGMYQIFSEYDIKNLKTIKNLLDDGMTIKEIKSYLKQNKEVIIEKKEIEVPEVSLLTVIAKILNTQNEKIETLLDAHDKILNINQQLIKNQEQLQTQFSNKMTEVQSEICIDLENQANAIKELQEQQKLDNLEKEKLHQEEVNQLKDEISKLNEVVTDKIDLIEQQMTKELVERENTLRKHMEERHIKLQEELNQEKNKSIWQKLFKK